MKAEEKVRHKNGTYFYILTSNLRVNDENGYKLRITTAADATNRLRNELIQSILLNISNLTNHNTPIEELFQSVHEAVCKLLPIKNFTVCVKNKDATEFPYSVGESVNYDEWAIHAEFDYILECKESVVLDSISIDELISVRKLNKYNSKTTSILGVPLNVKNEIQGALIIKDYSKTRFTKEDKELLESVADQLARVIERKRYEEDLINAKRRAEEAVKLKSDFLAQISHEIRTPLNSILSFSALLKEELQGKLTPELNETFNYIKRGGNRLTRTRDLLLNVSKSKNHKYKICLEDINLI